MSQNIKSNSFLRDFLKGSILATLFSIFFVLLFALLMRVFSLDSSLVSTANIIIKIASVFVAVLLTPKGSGKFFWKAILIAVGFVLLSNLLFLLLGGQLVFGDVAKDLAICIITAFMACIMALNRKK